MGLLDTSPASCSRRHPTHAAPGPHRPRVPRLDDAARRHPSAAPARRRGASRPSSEALSVPAIFRAVMLISNTVGRHDDGSLARRAHAGAEGPPAARSSAPTRSPRRGSSSATRPTRWRPAARRGGGSRARDVDEAPMSLYPVPPQEIIVSQNDANRLRPKIEWLGRTMRQRGHGADRADPASPVPCAGRARSRSAARRSASASSPRSTPPTSSPAAGCRRSSLKSALSLSPQEAADLKNQWMETPSNMPKVIDPGMESVTAVREQPGVRAAHRPAAVPERRGGPHVRDPRQPAGVQQRRLLADLPERDRGLDPVPEGHASRRTTSSPSSRRMSDLLTRATICRFDLDGLLRADVKTRFEVHEKRHRRRRVRRGLRAAGRGHPAGQLSRRRPVPLSPPQAVPTLLPDQPLGHAGRPLLQVQQGVRQALAALRVHLPALQDAQRSTPSSRWRSGPSRRPPRPSTTPRSIRPPRRRRPRSTSSAAPSRSRTTLSRRRRPSR